LLFELGGVFEITFSYGTGGALVPLPHPSGMGDLSAPSKNTGKAPPNIQQRAQCSHGAKFDQQQKPAPGNKNTKLVFQRPSVRRPKMIGKLAVGLRKRLTYLVVTAAVPDHGTRHTWHWALPPGTEHHHPHWPRPPLQLLQPSPTG